MTAAGPLALTAPRFTITVREGPDKGTTYQLLPPKVTIGRDATNDIILADPRCSRNHAVIEFSPQRILIRDISSRHSMRVNGDAKPESPLTDGDIVALGDSELMFRIEKPQMPAAPGLRPDLLKSPGGVPMSPPMSPSHMPPSPGFRPGGDHAFKPRGAPGSRRAKPPSGRGRFYTIVAVVGLLFVWLLQSEPSKKEKNPGMKTSQDIETDIKSSEERQEAMKKKRSFASEEEQNRYDEAQRHYLEGFRDYQKGQYARALRSLETAKAIDPNHEMAHRYHVLAERQRDELAALHMLEGQRYKERGMFNRCSSAMTKVMNVIDNKQNLKFKQAQTLKSECDLLGEER